MRPLCGRRGCACLDIAGNKEGEFPCQEETHVQSYNRFHLILVELVISSPYLAAKRHGEELMGN